MSHPTISWSKTQQNLSLDDLSQTKAISIPLERNDIDLVALASFTKEPDKLLHLSLRGRCFDSRAVKQLCENLQELELGKGTRIYVSLRDTRVGKSGLRNLRSLQNKGQVTLFSSRNDKRISSIFRNKCAQIHSGLRSTSKRLKIKHSTLVCLKDDFLLFTLGFGLFPAAFASSIDDIGRYEKKYSQSPLKAFELRDQILDCRGEFPKTSLQKLLTTLRSIDVPLTEVDISPRELALALKNTGADIFQAVEVMHDFGLSEQRIFSLWASVDGPGQADHTRAFDRVLSHRPNLPSALHR